MASAESSVSGLLEIGLGGLLEKIGGWVALGLGILVVLLIFVLVWYVLQVVAYWKIFTKAGKPGWHSIIPILNVYTQYDLSWKGYWGLITFGCFALSSILSAIQSQSQEGGSALVAVLIIVLFIAGVVLTIIGMNKLSKAFGHGIGFTLGLIFFEPIFMLILGFGGDTYQGRG